MKEIGEKLKTTREDMGISIDEAAEDLKLRTSQIEAIEAGNMESFKDVFNLKYFIRDYAKYLGLNYEDVVDDFNEYLFDYTSKLSLDEIKKAHKEEKEDTNRIKSPYTLDRLPKRPIFKILIAILIFMLLVVSIAFFVSKKENIKESDEVVLKTL